MTREKLSLFFVILLITFTASQAALSAEQECFTTQDGMEVCIKQKASQENIFTQADANQLAEALPKLTAKQLSALKILLKSQQHEKISSQEMQSLVDAIPKLPDELLDVLTLYVQSNEGKTIQPEEIQNLFNNLFDVPKEYQDTLQSALKLFSEKGNSEVAAMTLLTEFLQASKVPSEIGDTVQSYFNMVNQDSEESEEQFLKAGVGLLKFIIKATKDDDKSE